MNASHRIVPVLSLVLCGPVLAQFQLQTTTTVTTRNASFFRSIGDPELGASIDMRGRAESRITNVGPMPIAGVFRVDGSAVGRVSVFGVTREAAALTGFGQVDGSLQSFGATAGYDAGFSVRLGGQTVYAPTYSGSVDIVLAASRVFNNPTILSASTSVPTPIGLSVNLRVDVGANASIALSATLQPQQLRARLTGTATGVATGRASASVGVLCASAGVEFDLRLLDTRLTASFDAGYLSGLSGTLGYRVEAARMLINLFAELCGLRATVNVFDRTYGIVSGTRTLL